MQLTKFQLKNYCLVDIEKILQGNGTTLRNFSNELCPDDLLIRDNSNKFIMEELRYDKEAMRVEHENLYSCLTTEQKTYMMIL